eukprot:scaffold2149_cov187-Cylindrotheca_fusiformis.AAC.2
MKRWQAVQAFVALGKPRSAKEPRRVDVVNFLWYCRIFLLLKNGYFPLFCAQDRRSPMSPVGTELLFGSIITFATDPHPILILIFSR